MRQYGSVILAGWIFGAAALSAPAASTYWMEENEAAANLVVLLPDAGDFDVYDQGWGAELQYRHWLNDVFGFAGGIGYESWQAGGESRNWLGRVDGDLTLIPVGASALLRVLEFSGARVTLEGGLRYAFADSDVTLFTGGREDTVDISGGLVLRLAADLEISVTDRTRLFGGIGYQQDLAAGDAEAFGNSLIENELSALFFRGGVKVSF